MGEQTFVVVGGGLAGAKAVETLREEGFDGRIVLIGDEPDRPYERPPLSKDVLKGVAPAVTAYVHPAGWYAEHEIELHTGVAARTVDRDQRRVRLADGSSVTYDKLLLATGATPRRLALPGADLSGVHYLRTMGDSTTLAQQLPRAGRVVVIGASWIGLEVAAAARHHGADVVLIEPERTPLFRLLGPELGAAFAGLHRDHGVDLRVGNGVVQMRGRTSVEQVVLADGTAIEGDLVVAGVGVNPQLSLARSAGLVVDNGVQVDELLRSSDPAIFAAGDIMNAFIPRLGRHLRVDHWANALHSGQAAARSMLGKGVAYDRVPYFYTDQYDLSMEYAGSAPPGSYDRVVVRGDVGAREFVAFWLRGDHVVAGMSVNVWNVIPTIEALIRSSRPVDADRLGDASVPLAESAAA